MAKNAKGIKYYCIKYLQFILSRVGKVVRIIPPHDMASANGEMESAGSYGSQHGAVRAYSHNLNLETGAVDKLSQVPMFDSPVMATNTITFGVHEEAFV